MGFTTLNKHNESRTFVEYYLTCVRSWVSKNVSFSKNFAYVLWP